MRPHQSQTSPMALSDSTPLRSNSVGPNNNPQANSKSLLQQQLQTPSVGGSARHNSPKKGSKKSPVSRPSVGNSVSDGEYTYPVSAPSSQAYHRRTSASSHALNSLKSSTEGSSPPLSSLNVSDFGSSYAGFRAPPDPSALPIPSFAPRVSCSLPESNFELARKKGLVGTESSSFTLPQTAAVPIPYHGNQIDITSSPPEHITISLTDLSPPTHTFSSYSSYPNIPNFMFINSGPIPIPNGHRLHHSRSDSNVLDQLDSSFCDAKEIEGNLKRMLKLPVMVQS